jgi:hypothetical protein
VIKWARHELTSKTGDERLIAARTTGISAVVLFLLALATGWIIEWPLSEIIDSWSPRAYLVLQDDISLGG